MVLLFDTFAQNFIFMFRHQGKARTFSHNLKIASLLSFVAGMVNVAGFLSVQKLTTNVTGHFAFFVDEVFHLRFRQGTMYAFYILFFFLGAFFSSLLVELLLRKNERFAFTIPVFIECVILFSIGCIRTRFVVQHTDLIAFSLLFAMGLQNSLVTSISRSIVRTTHLTGLFTDLGIEAAQLFFYKTKEQQKRLRSSVRLRITIIFYFFSGGVAGGVLYRLLGIKVLMIAAALLFTGLVYDHLKVRVRLLARKMRVHS